MSNTWLCIPSARPPAQADSVLIKWREMGYKISLYCDIGKTIPTIADRYTVRDYKGYAHAVNLLVADVLAADPECDWIVTGGDDILPDPKWRADEIARQCSDYFAALHAERADTEHPKVAECSVEFWEKMKTFGVMQPTGDRWGDDAMGRARWPDAPGYIDRVCGSPWLGREFCKRVNGGLGPIWSEYVHMFEDEELQNVAQLLGVLWQRRDLTHFHQHWGRDGDPSKMPEFLAKVSGPEHWKEASELFGRRKEAGFPGHEVLR